MSAHLVGGNSQDYGGDDDPPEHGRDTAVYQDLLPVIRKYKEWRKQNRDQLYNDEMQEKAAQIERLLDEISDELNTPL